MNHTKTQTHIITLKDIKGLKRPLPESLTRAAGLLRHKKKELEQHIKKVRLEWDRVKLI